MHPGGNTTQTSSSIWLEALNSPTNASKSKARLKKSEIVVYPELEVAVTYTTDPFWVDILHQCARKKFPRGFMYEDNQLRHRTNNISILLPDDPAAKAQTMIHFFQENGKLYSKRDQERRRLKDEEKILAQLANDSTSWKCVSYSKNRRATHVRDYVERKYSHLTNELRDEIYTQIEVGFETKYILKEHIYFENGQIINIDGIHADERGVAYTRPRNLKIPVIAALSESPKPKVYRHYENWTKYLENYCKYIVISAKAYHTTLQTAESS